MSNSRLAFEQAIENEHPDDYSFDFDPNGHYRDEILSPFLGMASQPPGA